MKVSVIMPVYNGEKYLQEAIDSILAQTFTDYEFIIIDDGSSDDSLSIIQKYAKKNKRIVVIRNAKNLGICVTLNKGLEIAQGEYIVRMDCDDISLPYRLERQVEFMDLHKEVAVAGCFVEMFNSENPACKKKFRFSTNYYECKAELLFSPCVAHPAVIIRKSILDEYNIQYDDYFRGMEDFHIWWRISHYSYITNLQEVLLRYRIHNNQNSKKKADDEFRRKISEFTIQRINDFKIQLQSREIDSIIKYITDNESYSDDEVKCFISALSKILMYIKRNDRQYYKAYRLIFGKAVSYVSIRSVKNLQKPQLYYIAKAYNCGCMDTLWFLKNIYHYLVSKK